MPFTLEDIKAPSSRSTIKKEAVEVEPEHDAKGTAEQGSLGESKGPKEEPTKPVEPPKKKSLLPVISFKKAEKTREEILYLLLLDSTGDLPRLFEYLDITRWDEKRKWIFLWVDMSKCCFI